MKASENDIRAAAKLAMLDVDKLDGIVDDIVEITEMAKVLDKIEVCDFEENVIKTDLREDCAQESILKSDALRNATSVTDGFFVVPKTVG